jgi:dGTPase
MVGDVIATSRGRLADAAPADVVALRALGAPVIRFSSALWQDLQAIRAFLFARMYRAPAVNAMRAMVDEVVRDLFPIYLDAPEHLPDEWRADVARAADRTALARLVSDYIAGMTDRFALESHARLTGKTSFSREGV